MSNRSNTSGSSSPASLHLYAQDNLQFIRDTMEGAVSFTGISGKANVFAGVSAMVAAGLAARQTDTAAWLIVWMAELGLASAVGFVMTAAKARSQGSSLWSANGIKVLLAFIPAMVVGGILTLALYLQNDVTLLPGVWLCLYGASVMTGGAYSVPLIPVMGATFIVAGTLALFAPFSANTVLGVSLGLIHILLGSLIWKNYGG